MFERCPTCRARLCGEVICPRCQSDLTPLLQLTQQARVHHRRALESFKNGDLSKALTAIQQALRLHRTPERTSLEARIRAYLGDFGPAARILIESQSS